ncbi:Fic/DOC family protein [Methanolobus profundi]|uniref:Fic/DOC family protein n=1 Tax=Methanolobus profundi TaxID=487685 RepID=A0A1I4RAT0_9EURY|nr:Fic/DOC family protein [Methanolobus profundi]
MVTHSVVHIERRKQGQNTKYYLTHSYRVGKKTKKIRHYLGLNLTDEEIEERREDAEREIEEQIQAKTDLLKFSLTKKEIEKLSEYDREIEVVHLDVDGWKAFTEKFVFNTNAIEGSTVSPEGVHKLLSHNETATNSDEIEALNVAEAVEFIQDTDEELSVDLIKELHRICFDGSKSFAGRLRNVEVVIRNAYGEIVHQGIPKEEIGNELEELSKWYRENETDLKPLVLAALVHNQFEYIHPFEDGNGRVGRLLLNYVLLRHDYPPINILFEDRGRYYYCLQQYSSENRLEDTLKFLVEQYQKGL